jgi:hypothetical protein
MNPFSFAAASAAVVAALFCTPTMAGSLSPLLKELQQHERADVIVIMRDQMDSVPATRSWRSTRALTIDAAQSGVVGHLRSIQAENISKFRLINAVAARVSKEQAEELAANPSVQAVVADRVIRSPHLIQKDRTVASVGAVTKSDLCDTLEPEALQLTNTAFPNSAISQAHAILDGHGRPVTGRDVKVAFMADGIDTNNKGFIRPDGSRVFVDYEDFSGDPTGTPTGGAEAFGDASSIAAQDMPNGKPLTFDISDQSLPGRLPTPCRIRIRGVAPGASLVGLKIYSSLGYTTELNFIRAIEYAVLDADVDVLNESFAGNFYPDEADDALQLASAWAVKAGVTVVTSTGDSGTAGTLGSPSTNPAVIAVGASTSFRAYSQLGGLGIEPLASRGYVSNNISAVSSGGFAQRNARTVDVVAPGDVGWALCSADQDNFQACGDFNGNPAPFQLFGGTSQATPFTSGAAALVIQAYRSTHRDFDPTPALVKRILMSTANDLGAPASEQGAGLINTLAAVEAALAVTDENGAPPPRGRALLMHPSSVAVVDGPESTEVAEITLTNTGSSSRHVEPHLQTLSKQLGGSTVHFDLRPGPSSQATVRQTFNVADGAEHLDAAIAYNNDMDSLALVDLQLIDPDGRIVAYSAPQGLGNGYGHADVVSPRPGKWTAVISTTSTAIPVSYSGPVAFTWSTQRWTTFGSLVPASLDIPKGASKSFLVRFRMPSQAGDIPAAIRFDGGESDGLHASVPVTLRSLIAVDSSGGTFRGLLTGGNGRPLAGPTQNFEFDVPRGAPNVDVTLDMVDAGYALQGFLVDPHGIPLSVQPNLDPAGVEPQKGLHLSRRDPEPGRWRFTLLQNYNSAGDRTSLSFDGRVSFRPARIDAADLPQISGTRLAAGRTVEVPVRITNNGPTTVGYFVDARRDEVIPLKLTPRPVCDFAPWCTSYFIPPATSGVIFVSRGKNSLGMYAVPESGYFLGQTNSPGVVGHEAEPGAVVASLFAAEIPYGPWGQYPAYLGPFGRRGTPTDDIDNMAYILYQPFDDAVTSDHGNKWLDLMTGTSTYSPLILAPGQSGTIHVKITPSASQSGQTVVGNLYVETYSGASLTGDELERLPYRYTIGP